MLSVTQKVARLALVIPLHLTGAGVSIALVCSSTNSAIAADGGESATLRISLKHGVVKGRPGKFNFFDASDGCPEYVDIPGHKEFLGIAIPSDSGTTHKLPVGQPVHVVLVGGRGFMRKQMGAGSDVNQRRALQVVLRGDAELRIIGFQDIVPEWEAAGEIEVQPGSACKAGSDDSEFGTGAEPEQELDGEAS